MDDTLATFIVAPYGLAGVANSSVEACIAYLKSKPVYTLDTETSPNIAWRTHPKAGLDPYLSDIVMLQLGDQYRAWALDMRYLCASDRELIVEFLSNPYHRKVGQNIKFDLKMIRHHFGIWLDNVWDTMVSEMILTCGIQKRGFSLEKLAKKYLGFSYASTNQLDLFAPPNTIHLTKETRKSFKHLKDEFTTEQVMYGLKDIQHTHEIYALQLVELCDKDLLSTAWLENQTVTALAEMEYFGFHLDDCKWRALADHHSQLQAQALTAILDCISKEPLPEKFYSFQQSLFERSDATPSVNINLSSSKQVVELCKALGIPTRVKDLKKSREKGEDIFKDSVEETVLKQHINVHPVVALYLEYKGYEKATTTYGVQFLEEHLHPITNSIHTNYWQILATGRLASLSPNLQQIPSATKMKGFRECFVPKEGRVLITADYSSQEIRILADKTGEPSMIEVLNSEDPNFHSLTARKVFNIAPDMPVPAYQRNASKMVAFLTVYGGGANKLSQNLGIPLEEAEEIIQGFFSAYSTLEPYFKRLHRFSFDNGYILIDRFVRRKSFLPNWEEFTQLNRIIELSKRTGIKANANDWKRFFVAKGQIERKSQNYGIQGQAASMTKLALVLFRHWIKQENLDAHLVACVHDEIVVESDEVHSVRAGELLRKAMLYAGKLLCSKVVMDSEMKISKSWEH